MARPYNSINKNNFTGFFIDLSNSILNNINIDSKKFGISRTNFINELLVTFELEYEYIKSKTLERWQREEANKM